MLYVTKVMRGHHDDWASVSLRVRVRFVCFPVSYVYFVLPLENKSCLFYCGLLIWAHCDVEVPATWIDSHIDDESYCYCSEL